jgi:hypothetical protein
MSMATDKFNASGITKIAPSGFEFALSECAC